MYFRRLTAIAPVLMLAACNASGAAVPPAAPQAAPSSEKGVVAVCSGSRTGHAQCDALVRADAGPNISGYTPAQLEQAYNITSELTNGAGQIVAVVTAYDNPYLASDLATYRSQFGLPTVHLTKFNQHGQQNNYPPASVGWGIASDIAVQMVAASCPRCTVYVVEADSTNWIDLEKAETEAVTLGATIVSNGFSGTGANVADFDTPGITYVAQAGDSGYSITDPADFGSVVSVGGTTLTAAGGTPRGWTESVWIHSGGGCSTVAKPTWQADPGCAYRTANDVSADADSNPGVAVYDSYNESGWFIAGGTGVATAFVAGIFGLAGNAAAQDGGQTFWVPANQAYLNAVSTGNDGSCATPWPYLCTAGTGQYSSYSGPGGWGSPNGIGAF
jgi:subtilase family serine protease